MALTTKLNLSNSKVYQATGDTLNLSGATIVETVGSLRYGGQKTFTNKYDIVDKNYVTGLTTTSGVQTANNGLTKTGTNVRLGGALTGDTTISGPYTLNMCGSRLNSQYGYQISGRTILCTSCQTWGSIFLGYQAGNATTTGSNNTGINGGLTRLTNGQGNVGIGYCSLSWITSGNYNVGLGYSAGMSTTGSWNIAIGCDSLSNQIGGGNCNVAVGSSALWYNCTGSDNVALGTNALNTNLSGCNNVGIGYRAGSQNSAGHRNVFIGTCAGYSETGSDKLYIDSSATPQPLIYGDFGANCLIVHGALKTSGATSLLVAPAAGTTSDAILVWNSTDKIVKQVSGTAVLTSAITGATNGLNKIGQTVRLGGALTGNTTIGSGSCVLGVNVSSFDVTAPVKICTTPATGLNTDAVLVWNSTDKCVKQINVTDVLSSGITGATNGLTKVGQQVKLGGALTGNTTIGSGSCVLSLNVSSLDITAPVKLCTTPATGLNTDGVLVWNSTDKCVKQINVADVLSSGITGATNGLTKTGQCVKLGGLLTENTTVDGSSATYKLSLQCLNSLTLGFNYGVVIDTNNNGGLRNNADYSANFVNESLVTKRYVTGNTIQTANNGLTKSGTNVRLGGALTGNTTISGTNTLSVTSPSNLDNAQYIKFCSNPPARSFCEGSLYYCGGTLNFDRNISGTTLQIGEETVLFACNVSASIIPNGTAVYICGAQGDLPTIDKSIGNNINKAKNTIGIATTDIAINGKGYVTMRGIVHDLNTLSWAAGCRVYLSATQAGCLTVTPPAYPNESIHLGYVICQNASTGTVLVSVDDETPTTSIGTFTGYTASTAVTLAGKMTCTDFDSYTGTTTPIINGLVAMCACAITGVTNGLTKVGAHSACLGGTITNATTICGAQSLKLGDLCGITLSAYGTTDIGINSKSNGGVYIKSQSGTVDSVSDFTNAIGIAADYNAATGFAIYDNRVGANQTGIVYASDYAANYVPRSLVDKAYVDSIATGLEIYESVMVATTGNTTLSGLTIVDGVQTTTGMRILVKDQTTGWRNGIYSASTGTWGRTSDYNFSPSTEVANGDLIPVTSGLTNANSIWILSTPNPIVSGTTNLVYTQFLQQVGITEGNGINLTTCGVNKQISVELNTNSGLQFVGTGLELDWTKFRTGLCCSTGGYVDLRVSKCAATGNAVPVAINTGGTNVLYVDSSTLSTCMGTPIISANNGLTKSGSNVRLGGAMTGDTCLLGMGYNLIVGSSTTAFGNICTNYQGQNFVYDCNGTPKGIQYGADYSATYVNRSLVDKGYVDGKVISGVLACNGLTKVNDTVILGGQLTGDTQVWLGSGRLCFNDGGTSCVDLLSECSNVHVQNGQAYMEACTNGTCLAKVCVVSGGTITLSTNATSNGVQITSPSTGAIYTSDYSSGFVNESLVTKRYVTGITSSLGIQTANNGLTKNGLNVRLGGALTGNTSITGAYTLSVCDGAQMNTTCGYQISGNTVFKASSNEISSIFIGNNAGNKTATGINNFGVGCQALMGIITGTNNIAIGYQALCKNTYGINNIALGCQALSCNTSGYHNVANGYHALYANTTGCNNAALVSNALQANTTGCNNTSIGYASLFCNTTGNDNFAVGYLALYYNVTGNNNIANGYNALKFNTASNNIAQGYGALSANTSGTNNIASGYNALGKNTTGSNNFASGYQALCSNVLGVNNIAIGCFALKNNNTSGNVALGFGALSANTSGGDNFASGCGAMAKNTTGSCNIAIGNGALNRNTSGDYNIANGWNALYWNTTGCNNTANGGNALQANTIGCDNIANGFSSLYRNTTGCHNIALGCSALYYNSTGCNNIANGYQALYNNTASNNIAQGYGALSANTSGTNNVASGYNAMAKNTTGCHNIAIGCNALYNNTGGTANFAAGGWALWCNTKGNDNIAIGTNALRFNKTGCCNIAIGYQTLYCNTSGCYNIAHGGFALYNNNGNDNIANGNEALYNNTSGSNNFANGNRALYSNLNGSNNVAVGACAIYSNQTGVNNIAIGYLTLRANLASNNVAFGYGALSANTTGTNNIASGYNAMAKTTTGTDNFASGYKALCSNTTGCYNVAIGCNAGYGNTIGKKNIAIGNEALYCNSDGWRNIALGEGALWSTTSGSANIGIGDWTLSSNTSGEVNVALAPNALNNNTSGCGNVGIGCNAGYNNSTGCYNINIGHCAGRNVLGSGNVILGSYAASASAFQLGSGNILIGNCAGYTATGDSKLYIDNSSTTQPLIYGDFSANCAVIHGAFKTSGVTSLLVAPATGTISDNVLVRNSGTGEIKMVAGSSLGDRNNIYAKTTVTTSTLLTTGSTYVILVNHTAPVTITLPASPIDGQVFRIKDAAYGALTNNITISGNGKNIDRQPSSALINTDAGALELVYDATLGWFSFSFIN